jgi:hypothetical protein
MLNEDELLKIFRKLPDRDRDELHFTLDFLISSAIADYVRVHGPKLNRENVPLSLSILANLSAVAKSAVPAAEAEVKKSKPAKKKNKRR